MKYDNIFDVLPNGLHDAVVLDVSIDAQNKTINLEVNAWIGKMNSDDIEVREMRQNATLTINCSDIQIMNEFVLKNAIGSDMDSGLIDQELMKKHGLSGVTHYLYFNGINDLVFINPSSIEIKKLSAQQSDASETMA